jgi:DNA polymerase elongation subunit (family B)
MNLSIHMSTIHTIYTPIYQLPAGCVADTRSTCSTFESNVPFVLRFMIDNEVTGSNWLELPPATYSRRSQHTTYTQVSSQCHLCSLLRSNKPLSIFVINIKKHPALSLSLSHTHTIFCNLS